MSTSFSGSLPLPSTLFVFYYIILTLWQIKYVCMYVSSGNARFHIAQII